MYIYKDTIIVFHQLILRNQFNYMYQMTKIMIILMYMQYGGVIKQKMLIHSKIHKRKWVVLLLDLI
jgi:hypothetical protein